MFKKTTVKAFSIVAIVLSIIGLLLSVLGSFFLTKVPAAFNLVFFMGIVSWTILLWASVIGYKLCTSYNLYDDEYKKVGIRIYLVIVAFILFFFVGLVIGLVLAVILLSTLWGLKKNYDEWNSNNPQIIEPTTVDTTNNP